MTYLIADDDPIYLAVTMQQLSLIPNLTCVAQCGNAVDARVLLQKELPDILILDIEMPDLTGIQLAKSLPKLPMVIFISSHPNYAADAFDIDAIDYLVKPVPVERIMRAVDKARNLHEMKQQITQVEAFKNEGTDSFFIKDKNSFIRINYCEVCYIESLGDFITIFLVNGDKKIALVNLKNVEQQLPANIFIRISRSHIVHKDKITALDHTHVQLNKIKLSIGKTYQEIVLQTIMGNQTIKRHL